MLLINCTNAKDEGNHQDKRTARRYSCRWRLRIKKKNVQQKQKVKEKKSKKELNERQLNLSKCASLDLFDSVVTRGSEIVSKWKISNQ